MVSPEFPSGAERSFVAIVLRYTTARKRSEGLFKQVKKNYISKVKTVEN